MCNHHSAAVPPKRVLQESCELAVSIVDIVGPCVSPESVDTVPQGQQGAVDVSTLYHTLATIL